MSDMNYYALDEALAFINGDEISLSYYIEVLNKFDDNLGEIFTEETVVTEGAKEFFAKIKNAIITLLKKIKEFFIKIGGFIKNAVRKLGHQKPDCKSLKDWIISKKEIFAKKDESVEESYVIEEGSETASSVNSIKRRILSMLDPYILVDFSKYLDVKSFSASEIRCLGFQKTSDEKFNKIINKALLFKDKKKNLDSAGSINDIKFIGLEDAEASIPDKIGFVDLASKIYAISSSNLNILSAIENYSTKLHLAVEDLDYELEGAANVNDVDSAKIIAKRLSQVSKLLGIYSRTSIHIARSVGKAETLVAYINTINV